MVPVLGRKVEEGEQSFPVLGQAGDRLVVLGAVLVGEHINGRLGCRAGRRTVNFTKVCLHNDLDRESNFVQHVGCLVNPTPLVPGARKDLLDCLPEAERAPRFREGRLADREVGRDLEPTLLDVDEEFTPALCARAPRSGTRPIPSCPRGSRRSARAYTRRPVPSGPASRPHPPTRTRIAAPTGRVSARHRNPPAIPPSAARSRLATGSARPCPRGRRSPPGSRRSTPRAGREQATARRDSSCAVPTSVGSTR